MRSKSISVRSSVAGLSSGLPWGIECNANTVTPHMSARDMPMRVHPPLVIPELLSKSLTSSGAVDASKGTRAVPKHGSASTATLAATLAVAMAVVAMAVASERAIRKLAPWRFGASRSAPSSHTEATRKAWRPVPVSLLDISRVQTASSKRRLLGRIPRVENREARTADTWTTFGARLRLRARERSSRRAARFAKRASAANRSTAPTSPTAMMMHNLPTPHLHQYSAVPPLQRPTKDSCACTFAKWIFMGCTAMRTMRIVEPPTASDEMDAPLPPECRTGADSSTSPVSVVVELDASPPPQETAPSPHSPARVAECTRAPFQRAETTERMATLVSAVHQAYLTMVHRGHFVADDFHTGLGLVELGADSPDFDVMGVSTNAITILRRVLPEQIFECCMPYEAAVVASAALLVSYKIRCESAQFWHRQVAVEVLTVVLGEAAQQPTGDKIDADVEAGEAWIAANWNLYALVNDGLYWHFESELSRYHANEQITFFELIGCLSAGAFVHRAAATNPEADVLEDIASHVGVARLGQALALVERLHTRGARARDHSRAGDQPPDRVPCRSLRTAREMGGRDARLQCRPPANVRSKSRLQSYLSKAFPCV